MTKLIELQSQIDKLQKQAAEIRSKEYVATVADIRQLMAAYGITIKDLQNPKAGSKGAKTSKLARPKGAKAKAATTPVAPKYKGPNGETWSGRGLTPKWLSALIASGQIKESFLISPSI
jgi:DNA-binding protein H-NS